MTQQGDLGEQPEGLLDDFTARTRELGDWVRWQAVGPNRNFFWPVVVVFMVVCILTAHHYLSRREPAPLAAASGPRLHCISGRVQVQRPRTQMWKAATDVYAGDHAVSVAAARRTVLVFGDDSNVRLRGRGVFNWQHRRRDGRMSFTLTNGRAWIALSPLDSIVVDFPQGVLDCGPGSIVEVNLRPPGKLRAVFRVRRGTVKAMLRMRRREPVKVRRSAHGGPLPAPFRHVWRFRRIAVTLTDGQGIGISHRPVHLYRYTRFKPDDAWQKWNAAWNTQSEFPKGKS